MPRRFGIRFEEPRPAPTPAAFAGAFPATPGLYLHVPFCRAICPFCPYNKVPYRDDRAALYMEHLEREVAMHLAVTPGPFPSLYVGGGTPTLCLDDLAALLERLPVAGERAIEVLPTHMTAEGARRIREAGFDYVSLGVQSFDPAVLTRLRRPGSPATSRSAIATALGSFSCVDVDLIFDAGYDDPQVLLADLDECFGAGVDQVSTYPLMRFGYTPFGKGEHRRRREHALLRQAAALAETKGYERRSVWTFNRVGSPAYTSITRPYFLGVGAGAATFAGSFFAVNHFGLNQYGQALERGELPVARVARLPTPAAAVYRLFWQAYTGAIPLDADDVLLAHPVAHALRGSARALGWSQRSATEDRLTASGYDRYHDLERWVTYHLIEPLWAEMMHEHDVPETAPLHKGGVPG
ncbi:MAG TPA: radical SAM protein [Acidimicrobiales bacterium]